MVFFQCAQVAVSRSTSARPVEDVWRSIISVLYYPTAISMSALSRVSPTELIDPAMPESSSAPVNANEVY